MDPNAVTREGKDQGNKRQALLKSCLQKPKADKGNEKQSSNQGRDKVAKQKYKLQINVKVQIKHGKNAKKIQNLPNRKQEHEQEHEQEREQEHEQPRTEDKQ